MVSLLGKRIGETGGLCDAFRELPLQGSRAPVQGKKIVSVAVPKLFKPPPPSNRVFALISHDRVGGGEVYGYSLYELHLKGNSSDEVILHRSFPMLKTRCNMGSAVVTLGSKIYVLGGCCALGKDCSDNSDIGWNLHLHPDVHFLDTLRPEAEWIRCASMGLGRLAPVATAVDGKIYVFGGAREKQFTAEVYDPEENKWEFLPTIPEVRGMGGGSMTHINAVVADADGENKRILVHGSLSQKLYAYFIDSNQWKCLDPNFGNGPYGDPFALQRYFAATSAVVEDNFLYLYSSLGCMLHSYDLINKTWAKCPVDFDDEIIYQAHVSSLFVLGSDTLCFLWFDERYGKGVPIGCRRCKINANGHQQKERVRVAIPLTESVTLASFTLKDDFVALTEEGFLSYCQFFIM